MSPSGSPDSPGAPLVAIAVGLIAGLHAWLRPPAWIDGAFVPYRYADRFAEGLGLSQGSGSPTEGFFDPLWTLGLAVLSALGMDVVKLAPMVGIVGFGLVCALVVAASIRRNGSCFHALPGLLLALWAPAAMAARDGTDAHFVGLLGVLCVLGVGAERDASNRWGWTEFGLVLLAWTGVPGAVLAVVLSLGRVRRMGLVLGALALLCLWRLWLFGDLVPTAVRALPWGGDGRIPDGLSGLGMLFVEAPFLAWGALLGALVGWSRGARVRGVVALVLVHAVYQIGLGTPVVWGAFVPAMGGLALLMAEAMAVGRGSVRWVWLLVFLAAAGVDTRKGFIQADAETSIRAEAHGEARAMARFLRWRFEPDATIVVHAPGVVPYYSQIQCIDLFGQTDEIIARSPRVDPTGTGRPVRFDVSDVLDRNPDAFLTHTLMVASSPTRIPPPRLFTERFDKRYMQHAVQLRRAWKITGSLPAWVHIYIRRDLPMLRPEMSEKDGNRLPSSDPFGEGRGDVSTPSGSPEDDTGN